ncbi:MAG: hypothetical protein GYB39_07575 [Algicola sp.]|nr:hypothetical protein [Algicola sp.]
MQQKALATYLNSTTDPTPDQPYNGDNMSNCDSPEAQAFAVEAARR